MSWEENVTGLVQPCPGHTQFSQPLLNPENAKGTQRRLYLGLKNKNVLPLLQGHSTQSSNRDRQASHGKDGLAREICPEEHLTILLKEKKKKKGEQLTRSTSFPLNRRTWIIASIRAVSAAITVKRLCQDEIPPSRAWAVSGILKKKIYFLGT